MQRTQRAILDTEERAAVIDRAKSHLEMEKQRISQLLSMLSDFSTQAALLAGCAISGIGGEAIDSLDDELDQPGHTIGSTIFLASGALAVSTSLWVIFIASHLSSLTRDSALKPRIIEARVILEEGVHEVRVMQWFALVTLLVQCCAGVWLNSRRRDAIAFTLVLLLIAGQALLKKRDITHSFRERCGDEWTSGETNVSESIRAFVIPFLRPCLGTPAAPQHQHEAL